MNIFKMYMQDKEIQNEKKRLFNLLDEFDFSNIENIPPKKINKIVMLLPNIFPSSGGVTSALRLLTSFQQHDCQITIALIENMNVETATKNAITCMPGFKGTVKRAEDCLIEQYDICISTNWETAYVAKKFKGYKVYFVQDYEPNFYETNDFSVLARDTYKFGYHVISLGKWNLNQIKMNVPDTQSKLDYVDFPYARNEYSFHTRDYMSYGRKKRIRIACYMRFTGRRIPYICEYILKNVRKELLQRGYEVDISYFGSGRHYKFEGGINLGILSRSELAELYLNSDFGMVASMSNISLVPYEMLASGLPLIEFKEGSYPYFLGEDTAILTDFNYKTLCNRILGVLQDPLKLVKMHEKAEEKLEKLSWDETCNQFWELLKKTIV